MYICSNCGTAFDGGVCPTCCTMRPAAAVLGSSGRILRNRDDSAVPPQEQAERFAEELEYSRKADAWRRQQQEHAEEMRRRAAELAQAAQRQREQPPVLSAEEQRYARQAEKAVNWKRKAPGLRVRQPEEVEVEMPDALRSLKIDSKNPDKPTAAQTTAAKKDIAKANVSRETSRSLSYPVSPQVPAGNSSGNGRSAAGSQKIDAAWRSFARREAATGKNVSPRLPEEAGGAEKSLPRPPAVPAERSRNNNE